MSKIFIPANKAEDWKLLLDICINDGMRGQFKRGFASLFFIPPSLIKGRGSGG